MKYVGAHVSAVGEGCRMPPLMPMRSVRRLLPFFAPESEAMEVAAVEGGQYPFI